MSHELRTPLNAIGGFVELIALGIYGPVTDEQQAALTRIALSADRQHTGQILLNLLSNAVKFTGRGGRIEVACETRRQDVLIHVRDTGIGIPPDRLELIFEPFAQAADALTAKSQGAGLGLAISRDLATAMGGDLTAESTQGEGSRVTLRLPRAAVSDAG